MEGKITANIPGVGIRIGDGKFGINQTGGPLDVGDIVEYHVNAVGTPIATARMESWVETRLRQLEEGA